MVPRVRIVGVGKGRTAGVWEHVETAARASKMNDSNMLLVRSLLALCLANKRKEPDEPAPEGANAGGIRSLSLPVLTFMAMSLERLLP